MKKIYVYLEEKNINLLGEGFSETIFNLEEYRDILNNISTEKYQYFKKIHRDKEFTNEYIENQYIPLFNFILSNNTAAYIIDKVRDIDYEILFRKDEKMQGKTGIKITGELDIETFYANLFNILRNYNVEAEKNIKLSEEEIQKVEISKKVELNDLFYYISKDVVNLRENLEKDLIAFKYVEKDKLNEEGRYNLPVYIDREKFREIGIENIEEYEKNWESIGYLKMITMIHDHFITYYKLNLEKGLNIDALTLTLLELLDSEIRPYPQGLKKSIEIGRATSGKCFFVDNIMVPISLSIDMMLILQGKDLYSVVTKVSKNKK